MPTCHRLENNKKCWYWCKPNWIFCHNFYGGYCRNEVADYQCQNGWHITERRYRALKIAEQLAGDRESKHWKRKRCVQSEEPSDEETSQAKKYKRDPLLEVYLRRFGYTPDGLPDRREIEHAFLDATHMDNSASEFTYEEYAEAFQYIVDIITNHIPE